MKRLRLVSGLIFATCFSFAFQDRAAAINVDGADCKISNEAGVNRLQLRDAQGTLTGANGAEAVRLSTQGSTNGGLSLTFEYVNPAFSNGGDDLVAYFLSPQFDVVTKKKVAVGTVFVSSKAKALLPGSEPQDGREAQYLMPIGSVPQTLPEGFRPWAVAECTFK